MPDETLTFREHARRAGLPESVAERVIRERNWTGDEQLRQIDYQAVLADTLPADALPADAPEPAPPAPEAPAEAAEKPSRRARGRS